MVEVGKVVEGSGMVVEGSRMVVGGSGKVVGGSGTVVRSGTLVLYVRSSWLGGVVHRMRGRKSAGILGGVLGTTGLVTPGL